MHLATDSWCTWKTNQSQKTQISSLILSSSIVQPADTVEIATLSNEPKACHLVNQPKGGSSFLLVPLALPDTFHLIVETIVLQKQYSTRKTNGGIRMITYQVPFTCKTQGTKAVVAGFPTGKQRKSTDDWLDLCQNKLPLSGPSNPPLTFNSLLFRLVAEYFSVNMYSKHVVCILRRHC